MPGRDTASILHADLDSFYASVEQRDDPALRGRPVAVGGGVILAASSQAKAHGVRAPMGGWAARRLCPDLLVVPPRMAAYSEASRAVFAIFQDTTPVVEGLSIDEAFLDVGGLRRLAGSPVAIAERLRARVGDEVGLPISVGAATTKHLAKVASAVAKPDGLLEVPPGTELAFLHPLPVERLWGVGPVTSARLRDRGVRTVGEMADLPVTALVGIVGPAAGRHLHALALGLDPRRVVVGRRRGSVGAQHALGRGRHSRADVEVSLMALVDRVARRLRAGHRVGRTVVVRLRFGDFERATRSHTVPEATAHTPTLQRVARLLLSGAWPLVEQRGITLVGVAVSNLSGDAAVQLALPFERGDDEALDSALDKVHDRFGSGALTRAALLGRRHHQSVPLLPD